MHDVSYPGVSNVRLKTLFQRKHDSSSSSQTRMHTFTITIIIPNEVVKIAVTQNLSILNDAATSLREMPL